MRSFFVYTILSLTFWSCGSTENSDTDVKMPEPIDESNFEKNLLLQNEPDSLNNPIEKTQLKEKNQVNDYAEYFLQAKVFEDREKMDFEKGDLHYYEILDIKNGYAQVTGAYEGSYAFAIWRMSNGNDLVGKTGQACGPICHYYINFYEISADGDVDVTNKVLPMDEIDKHADAIHKKAIEQGKADESEPAQLKFILPRQGTQLEVFLSLNSNELEFPLVTLNWNKSTFSILKKHNQIPDFQ